MYGEQHPLTYKRQTGEKLVFGLSIKEAFCWGLGLYLSSKMPLFVPKIPINNVVIKNAHYLLPIVICLFFGYAEERKTRLSMIKYIQFYVRERKRKRNLI